MSNLSHREIREMTPVPGQAVTALPRPAGWFTAVGIHATRFAKRWRRSPEVMFTAVILPLLMMVIFAVMLRGMIEQFSGTDVNLAAMSVLVAVSSMLMAAIMGAGNIVQERHQGLIDRIDTLPGQTSAGFIGRIFAESLRLFVVAPVAIITAVFFGADFGGLGTTLFVAGPLYLVAIASGAFSVMMGYVANTPQGAVAVSPVIMVAMFFNTAIMPKEQYSAALRPVVEVSPITAVAKVANDVLHRQFHAGHWGLFALWFGGLVILSVIVIARKSSRRH